MDSSDATSYRHAVRAAFESRIIFYFLVVLYIIGQYLEQRSAIPPTGTNRSNSKGFPPTSVSKSTTWKQNGPTTTHSITFTADSWAMRFRTGLVSSNNVTSKFCTCSEPDTLALTNVQAHQTWRLGRMHRS